MLHLPLFTKGHLFGEDKSQLVDDWSQWTAWWSYFDEVLATAVGNGPHTNRRVGWSTEDDILWERKKEREGEWPFVSLQQPWKSHVYADCQKTEKHRQRNKKRQWGLFTKWRRSGSAGHFCTRVHAGCMAGWVWPRKTHLRRATFCFFCLTTLRVILTDDLCVRRTWKIKPEKELEQEFFYFFGSMTSEQCGTQNNVQHCRLACTVTRTAVVGGKRRLRLGFVFPTENGSTPSVLAVLVLCLRLLAFVTIMI